MSDTDIKTLVRDIVKEEIKKQVPSLIKKELKNHTEDIIAKLKVVENNLDDKFSKKKDDNKQLAVLQQNIISEVDKRIETNLLPRIYQLTKYVEEKTLDGTQCITDYRMQVFKDYNQEQKLLTSAEDNTPEGQRKQFMRETFFFNDDD